MLTLWLATARAQTAGLSVSFTTAPATANVGTPVNYVGQVNGSGGTNVWVTMVFSLGVDFKDANKTASSTGCVGYSDATPSAGTTVRCPWSGSSVTVNVTPKFAGTMKVIASVAADQFNTDLAKKEAGSGL